MNYGGKVMEAVKSKKKLIIILSLLVIIVVGAVAAFMHFKAAKPAAAKVENITQVKKGSIKVEISGSGVIEPIESYDISSLVSGKIVSSPFEEGDKIKKDDILYKIESTELEGNIQKTMNSIARLDLSSKDTYDNINKTVLYAGADGRLTNFNVKQNDTITTAKLGDIIDDSISLAKVPFTEAQVDQIYIGQPATVYSAALMSSINGTVSKIDKYAAKKANGAVLYTVEISIAGNSSLAKDSEVTAEIGGFDSPEAGKIDVPDSTPVTSALAGRVKEVYISNNDYVTKGQKILELEGDTYSSSLNKGTFDRSDLEVTLKTQQKQLENYNIKSPLDGIVLEKNKKIDDTVNVGVSTSALPLMVVADMSKMKFEMKIDELDINKISLGQSVNVTSDAVPDKTFNGKITSIAGKGTASNGVSTYLVEVTINEPGDLKPGMNVNAKTIVSEKNDILTVPASAIWKKDGKAFVSLPADENGKTKEVNVEIGINNKDSIEIVKGLNEGDKIVIPTVAKDLSGQKGTENPNTH